MMKESPVPENEPPVPAPWVPDVTPAPPPWAPAVKKGLLDRWRGRPKLSAASPKWIAQMALPSALVAALAAGALCYVAVWVFCRSEHSEDNFTLVMLGLLLVLVAVIPVLFLARSWRHYFIGAGCLLAGGLASTLAPDPSHGGDGIVAMGVGLGAGLGLGLGLARRTLSGAIGGLLLGQLAGLAGMFVSEIVVSIIEHSSRDSLALGMGMGMATAFGIMYLLLLLGLAAVEHAAEKLAARAKRKAAGDDEGEFRARE